MRGVQAIAIQGDKQVVDAFQELTRDKDSWIREAAVKALETIAIEDDELSKSTVTRNLQDSSWEVRGNMISSVRTTQARSFTDSLVLALEIACSLIQMHVRRCDVRQPGP